MKKSILIISIISLFIVSCENTYIAYHKAKDKNTVAAYEKFIEKYPHSKYVDSANAEITFLETGEYPVVIVENQEEISSISIDEEDFATWTIVSEQDDQEGYEEYLSLFPDGYYADSANVMLYFMNKTLELKFENEGEEEYTLQTLTLIFAENDEITGSLVGMKETDAISTWEGEISGIREGRYLILEYNETMSDGEEIENDATEEIIFELDNGGMFYGEDYYEVISEDFIPINVDEIN